MESRYAVTDSVIAVPMHVRRSQLSQMINHLLALGRLARWNLIPLNFSEQPRPFDFLINGEFLRVSLEKYIEISGASTVCWCS
jgi:ribosome biogenesis protein YTM1